MKGMKPRLVIGLLIILLLLSGCSAWEKAYEQASFSFRVALLKGPSALGFIKAMEPGIRPQVRLGDTVQYTFEEDEDKLYSQLSEGKIDIAVVPIDGSKAL